MNIILYYQDYESLHGYLYNDLLIKPWLVGLYIYVGDCTPQSHWEYFISHEIRIPSWTNQYFMECHGFVDVENDGVSPVKQGEISPKNDQSQRSYFFQANPPNPEVLQGFFGFVFFDLVVNEWIKRKKDFWNGGKITSKLWIKWTVFFCLF